MKWTACERDGGRGGGGCVAKVCIQAVRTGAMRVGESE